MKKGKVLFHWEASPDFENAVGVSAGEIVGLPEGLEVPPSCVLFLRVFGVVVVVVCRLSCAQRHPHCVCMHAFTFACGFHVVCVFDGLCSFLFALKRALLGGHTMNMRPFF